MFVRNACGRYWTAPEPGTAVWFITRRHEKMLPIERRPCLIPALVGTGPPLTARVRSPFKICDASARRTEGKLAAHRHYEEAADRGHCETIRRCDSRSHRLRARELGMRGAHAGVVCGRHRASRALLLRTRENHGAHDSTPRPDLAQESAPGAGGVVEVFDIKPVELDGVLGGFG